MSIRIQFVAQDGTRREVAATEGKSVMWAAVEGGVEGIVAECGGSRATHSAATKTWQVAQVSVPPPGSDERAMLEMTAAPRQPNSRLSCQLIVTPEYHGLTLSLPPTQY